MKKAKSKSTTSKRVFLLQSILGSKLIKFPFLLLLFGVLKIGQACLWLITKITVSFKYFFSLLQNLPRFHLKLPSFSFPKHIKSKKASIKHTYKFTNIFKYGHIKFVIFLALIILAVYSWELVKFTSSLPSPDRLSPNNRPLTTEILDRNGRMLYQIYEGENRKLANLDELPKHLVQATIAIEDKHFYSHPGIDPIGILRALKENLTSRDLTPQSKESKNLAGGSTITQQLIKNTLLSSQQTFQRKLKEVILAVWVERLYSKDEILQMYFNEAPFGGPAWGIEAASEMYFGKSASRLSLAESTYLAGLPASPTEYSPYGTYPQKGKKRQQEVLRRMVEDGYITQQASGEAALESLNFIPPTTNILAPHFVMYTKALLASRYGEKTVSQGGLKITTSLDINVQQMAEYILNQELSKLASLNVGNGGIIITDAQNGQILAMVGSRDYFDPKGGNFNTTLALRQPGSSIKPITYATAFKMGFSPGTVLLDAPATFPDGQKPYSPVNYDNKFHGPVTIRTALASSYNIPAVKVLSTIGVPNMILTAKDLGITTFTDPRGYGLSLTLGGGDVRLLDMMTVYGTFASSGIKHEANPILKVTDSFGNTIEDHTKDNGKRVLSEEIAYLISNILSDNNARAPVFGAHSLLEIPGHMVAVKTGTSDDKRDNWAIGYTLEYVVGVWVGNNDNSPMNPYLSSGITGATPIWHDLMSTLLEDRPNLGFIKPAGIKEGLVDGNRDLVISGQTSKSLVFKKSVKQKDSSGKEEEIITYSDPFSTFKPKAQ